MNVIRVLLLYMGTLEIRPNRNGSNTFPSTKPHLADMISRRQKTLVFHRYLYLEGIIK